MKFDEIFFWMLLGWLTMWLVKYVLVGLERWDTFFHPERLQADTTGPYSTFAKPFFGLFSGGCGCA